MEEQVRHGEEAAQMAPHPVRGAPFGVEAPAGGSAAGIAPLSL